MNLEIYLKKKNQVIRYFSSYCFKCVSLSPAGSAVNNLPAIKKTQETWGPLRRKWQPTPIFLLGKSHGQRSLVGYSPWGHKEPDTTEATEC